MWRVYDSNTSRGPTASNRRGTNTTRGDLKAHARKRQDAPYEVIYPGVWLLCLSRLRRCHAHECTQQQAMGKQEFFQGKLRKTMPCARNPYASLVSCNNLCQFTRANVASTSMCSVKEIGEGNRLTAMRRPGGETIIVEYWNVAHV